jgi:Ca2+/Na+ antiporter
MFLLGLLSGNIYRSNTSFYSALGLLFVGVTAVVFYFTFDFRRGGFFRCKGSIESDFAIGTLWITGLVLTALALFNDLSVLRLVLVTLFIFSLAFVFLAVPLTIYIKIKTRYLKER